MNRDFHYEGTFAAARIAGFLPAAAAKIAWAAQTVDECTQKGIDTYYPELNKWNPVCTCETTTESLADEASILSDETSSTLRYVREIWLPFHFLPGNVDGHMRFGAPSGQGMSQRDIRDFLCMCDANSDLVMAMVNRVIGIFRETDVAAQNNLLMYVGILMHVLADTWAHRFFTGTPNALVNSISNVTVISGKPEGYDGQSAPWGPTNYSMSYLGHGQIGHNPDYGSMTYSYQPSWKAAGSSMAKCGPDDFSSAFKQMEWALRCIRTGAAFTEPEPYPLPEKNWMTCVSDVVTTAVADQGPVWRRQMSDFVDYSALPAYSFDGKKRDMQYFQAYAREHRAFVLGKLQSDDNILNI